MNGYAIQVRNDPFQLRRDFVQDKDQSEVTLIQMVLQGCSERVYTYRPFLILSQHRVENCSEAYGQKLLAQGTALKPFDTHSL